jgi:protein arginine kinase
MEGDGPEKDVVVSSRVRLARNLAGYPFVHKAREDERRNIMDVVRGTIEGVQSPEEMAWVDLCELPKLDRQLLFERHLISKQHSKGTEPRSVAVSAPDESLSIMVNEEDHLRIQVLRPGIGLEQAIETINRVDDHIEQQLDLAYSPRFGYLTACPTNVGTGLRVSAMLHLPGLRLSGEIERVRNAAKAMNIAVRGFYGEGSDVAGDFYQLSNQVTLGRAEQDILGAFAGQFLPDIVEYERVARRSLLDSRRMVIEDQVFRALGTLTNARQLKSDEVLELLSYLRLGVCTGLVDLPLDIVGKLVVQTQPAHLQQLCKAKLDQAERRIERAVLVRRMLSEAGA